MTDLTSLSFNAQSLHATLVQAAQTRAQGHGIGYAQIHEDRVGGLGEPAPERSRFADDITGDEAFERALHAWQPREARDAVSELQQAGVAVSFSAGSRDRYIALDDYRLAVKS